MNGESDDPHDSEGTQPATRSLFGDLGEASRIGPYRLLQKIGEGGMGEVWEAEQESPLRRRVALKVIKWGMDTKEVVARFESERQALALMDHETVARVYAAGATDQGRPYFVMECVKGVPITEHCDRHRLTTRERLVLVAHVCEGVQHAHQKGIIHRDLKPSNILVTFESDRAVPKIIDFGVAKATAQRLTEITLFTELGVLIGTPEYMSPEQAEMTQQDVDTRTDVYSLGVVLYELLTGVLPFDSRELRRGGPLELRNRIREEQPSKPSAKVSSLGDVSQEAARKRRTDRGSLTRQLRGDLDWITMKAMDKDRTRRYGTVSELAADIGRYLRNEPVLAGPPSLLYRSRKFAARHRAGLIVAAAAFLTLAGLAVRERIQARRIATERDTAVQVSNLLTGLFEVSDPGEARGNTITAREVLDRGAEVIEKRLADQPVIQAHMMDTVGRVYESLGLYDRAEPMLMSALEIRRRVLGDRHPDTLRSINNAGSLRHNQGKLEDAERYHREALEGFRRVLGDDDPDTLRAMKNMGDLLYALGKMQEAEPYYREALEKLRRVLGNDDADTLTTIASMGSLLEAQGKLPEAELHYREALEGRLRVLGREHPDTLESQNFMGFVLQQQGKLQDAEPYYREALEGRRRVFGDDHSRTLQSVSNMGSLRKAQGKLQDAEVYYREALQGYRRALPKDHPDTLLAIGNVASVLWARGDLQEAEMYLREVLDAYRRVLQLDHPDTLNALNNMGGVLLLQGKLEGAERHFREALEGFRRKFDASHPQTLNVMVNLGDVYSSQGRPEMALPLLAEAVEGARKALPSGHRVTGKALNNRGRCLMLLKRYDEAEADLLEAHKILLTADANLAQKAATNLAQMYEAWGKPDKAAPWRSPRPES